MNQPVLQLLLDGEVGPHTLNEISKNVPLFWVHCLPVSHTGLSLCHKVLFRLVKKERLNDRHYSVQPLNFFFFFSKLTSMLILFQIITFHRYSIIRIWDGVDSVFQICRVTAASKVCSTCWLNNSAYSKVHKYHMSFENGPLSHHPS